MVEGGGDGQDAEQPFDPGFDLQRFDQSPGDIKGKNEGSDLKHEIIPKRNGEPALEQAIKRAQYRARKWA